MSWGIKMESRNATDTKIPVGDNSQKTTSNVIECSVNMNVSLSNGNKRSSIFQRAQNILIVILGILFVVLCSHLKKEVRALEVQINCANSNLMILMLRYEKLNKNFNRIRYHRLDSEFRSSAMESAIKYSGVDHSQNRRSLFSEEFDNSVDELYSKSAIILGKGPSSREAINESEREDNSKIDFDGTSLEEGRSIDDRVNRVSVDTADRKRYERAVVAFERRNREAVTTAVPDISDDFNDDTSPWSESRAARSRRDDGRGPLVATFVGAVPEQHVTDAVYVGPWVKSTRNESRYSFNKFHLVEDKKSIEVTVNGLYMISAQIYYFGEPTHYSYWILLRSEGMSHSRKVIKCATVSAVSTEASCYTSVVLPLRRGDRIHIQQQERDRLINLREGHSYVQIMLLSSESTRRRGS